MSSSHFPPNFKSFKLFLIQPAIIINHQNLWTQRCLISSGLLIEGLRQTEPLKDVRDIENQFYEETWSVENDVISTSFFSAISLWVFLILRNSVAFPWQAKALQVEELNPYTYRQAHIHVCTPSWQVWSYWSCVMSACPVFCLSTSSLVSWLYTNTIKFLFSDSAYFLPFCSMFEVHLFCSSLLRFLAGMTGTAASFPKSILAEASRCCCCHCCPRWIWVLGCLCRVRVF